MECFTINREKSNDSDSYKPLIGKEWILPKTFTKECKEATPVNYVCCQAYVQVLFEEKGKWEHGMIGELIVYKKENPPNEDEIILSFFSGPRQRFVINVSEIQKLSKPHPNLLVIIHGKTIMGINFPLEHQNRVDVFYQQLRPYLSSIIFAQRLKKVAENVSEEMKKKANKLINTISADDNQWFSTQKKIITKIVKRDQAKPKLINRNRRLSDPSLYQKSTPNSEESLKNDSNDDPPSEKAPKLPPQLLPINHLQSKVTENDSMPQKNNTIKRINIKKRVTFATDQYDTTLRRSQSLRKFYDEEIWIQYCKYTDADIENKEMPKNVKNLIDLWNSKS